MKSYRFALVVDAPDLQQEARVDVLFEAGLDDATVGRRGTVQYLDFDRRADSLAAAVLGAIRAVEGTGVGARVVSVEPDDLVTMAEIAERTGRTRESVRLLVNAQRGPGDFPAPATHLRSRQRLWRWQEVAAWFAASLDEPQTAGDPEDARFVTALNAALVWRRTGRELSDADREAIEDLALAEMAREAIASAEVGSDERSSLEDAFRGEG